MTFNVKINQQQLPIKMHYFFFMAAMGPILPFISVYGKQMGVSPDTMGICTAVLPILYFISKPLFGYLVDYFRDYRKIIFLSILVNGSLAFILLYFLPISQTNYNINLNTNLFTHPSRFCDKLKTCSQTTDDNNCSVINYQAEIICLSMSNENIEDKYSIKIESKYKFLNENTTELLWCLNSNSQLKNNLIIYKNYSTCDDNKVINNNLSCKINNVHTVENDYCLYRSYKFWIFIILMSIGNISFNVTNSLSDAICFDVLGEGGEMRYGRQRVWGTIGFGIAALIAGYAIDLYSQDNIYKSYTPAFILVSVFTCIDVICCQKIQLPRIETSKTIVKDFIKLLQKRTIAIFLIFATIAGIIDSFIIYFLFWYLEDLAIETNYMNEIKLIEGLTVAAETLGGEVIIFLFSGKIIKKLGYGYTFSLCFLCYALRLSLISLASNPWWIILVELFMQGPTYALSYTIIVSMASVIAPSGTSATMQGIAAGMDDGFGYALGSLMGGILYKKLGGVKTFRIFSIIALTAGITYLILYIKILKNELPEVKTNKNRRCNDDNITNENSVDALEKLQTVNETDTL